MESQSLEIGLVARFSQAGFIEEVGVKPLLKGCLWDVEGNDAPSRTCFIHLFILIFCCKVLGLFSKIKLVEKSEPSCPGLNQSPTQRHWDRDATPDEGLVWLDGGIQGGLLGNQIEREWALGHGKL